MKPPRAAVATLVLSAAAFVGIAVNEAYRDTAYYATQHEKERGISTVGFGATEGVKPGDKITVERALVRLLNDSDKYQAAVRRCAPVPMYQYEFDAYVSLTYNIGQGAFCGSTLAKKLNALDYEGACKEILRWDKQNGVVLRGLTIRRQSEYRTCIGQAD